MPSDPDIFSERRNHPRRDSDCQRGVVVGCSSRSGQTRVFPGTLVDLSDGGLGLEMLVPLRLGTIVSIAGELHGPDFCIGLNGRGWVTHCVHGGSGVFRVGISWNELGKRPLDCDRQSFGEPAGVLE